MKLKDFQLSLWSILKNSIDIGRLPDLADGILSEWSFKNVFKCIFMIVAGGLTKYLTVVTSQIVK